MTRASVGGGVSTSRLTASVRPTMTSRIPSVDCRALKRHSLSRHAISCVCCCFAVACRTNASRLVECMTEVAQAELRWRCALTRSASQRHPTCLASRAPSDKSVVSMRSLSGLRWIQPSSTFLWRGLGSGRTTTVQGLVSREAAHRPTPSDWCYLHNFKEPSQPVAVQLPAGRGPELASDLDDLVTSVRREVPRVFESDDYRQRQADLARRMREQRDKLTGEVRALAERFQFAVEFTPTGVITVPLLEPDKPMTEETFRLLPDEKQAELRAKMQEIMHSAEDVLPEVQRLQREFHEQQHALDREVVGFTVGHPRSPSERTTRGTRANALMTHDPSAGAPVVVEPNPTYYNLVGRVDFRASMRW